MKRLTQEDYIEACRIKHNDIYDYSLVEYKNISSKIEIICSLHGMFEQSAKNHKEGQGCPICVGRLQKIEDYIRKCEVIHNYKYSYELINTEYIKNYDYIQIINKEDNLVYIQSVEKHKMGNSPIKITKISLINKLEKIYGAKYNYIIKKDYITSASIIKIINNYSGDETYYPIDNLLRGKNPNKVTLNYFIKKCSEIHNNKYDYSLVNFNKIMDKVDIICPEHGIFNQCVSNHLNMKDGCPKCGGQSKYIKEEIIDKFIKIHFDKYDYSLINEVSCKNKLDIICSEHGIFKQTVSKHLSGQGCRYCNSKSIGEEYIKLYLDKEKISYIRQKGFDECRYINKLSFDFYLPELNTLIEFDGIQHYKPIKHFGGNKEYNDVVKRDECKNKWCLENKIKLIRISYLDKTKIDDILKNSL